MFAAVSHGMAAETGSEGSHYRKGRSNLEFRLDSEALSISSHQMGPTYILFTIVFPIWIRGFIKGGDYHLLL